MGREESMYGEQRKRVSGRGRGHRGPPEKHVYRVENRQRLQVPGKAWCGESPPGRGNEGGRGSGHPGRRETRVWGEPGPQGKGGHLTADVGQRRKGGEDISRKAIKKKKKKDKEIENIRKKVRGLEAIQYTSTEKTEGKR